VARGHAQQSADAAVPGLRLLPLLPVEVRIVVEQLPKGRTPLLAHVIHDHACGMEKIVAVGPQPRAMEISSPTNI